MATGIEDFPTELLSVVFEVQDFSEKKILRCVCKRFNSILEPLLFSMITINADPGVLARSTIPFCKALRSPQEASQRSLSIHVRQVNVMCRRSSSAKPRVVAQFNDIIGPTIAGLCNLEEFFFQIHESQPKLAWITLLVTILPHIPSKFLSQFSFCLDRTLDSDEISAIPKSLSSHFTTIIVTARGHRRHISSLLGPNLQRLIITPQSYSSYSLNDTFGGAYCVEGVPPLRLTELTMHELDMRSADIWEKVVGHLKQLKKLDLTLLENKQTAGKLWLALHTTKIGLTGLTYRGVVDNSLLRYLRDLGSALESLTLQVINLNSSQEEFDDLADEFYHIILPTLVNIRSLKIQPKFDGKWCFGPHNADGFCKYTTKLEIFTVSLKDERLSESVALAISRASALPQLKFFSLSHTYSTGRQDMDQKLPEAFQECGIKNGDTHRAWTYIIEEYKIWRIGSTGHEKWVYMQTFADWITWDFYS
ncbi:hypothetical protein VKT23_007702 [Stygiomarasmius scandens]|uniref:F-box domain-containing protein n=1 Tax=Marasmiellus scandens TaxID=2682957 RepID=A0ABR1JL66_9AGAR